LGEAYQIFGESKEKKERAMPSLELKTVGQPGIETVALSVLPQSPLRIACKDIRSGIGMDPVIKFMGQTGTYVEVVFGLFPEEFELRLPPAVT
jgi:hypothetical protein